MKEITEVVGKQLKMFERVSELGVKNMTGDIVSLAVVSLAANNGFLGEIVADLQYKVDMMEATKDHLWSEKYAEFRRGNSVPAEGAKPSTQKDSELFADQSVESNIKEIIEMKLQLNQVKNLRNDSRDLLTALQSRLGVLKQEMMESMRIPTAS